VLFSWQFQAQDAQHDQLHNRADDACMVSGLHLNVCHTHPQLSKLISPTGIGCERKSVHSSGQYLFYINLPMRMSMPTFSDQMYARYGCLGVCACAEVTKKNEPRAISLIFARFGHAEGYLYRVCSMGP